MDNNKLNEQRMRRQLKQETEPIVRKQRETWESIQQELFPKRRKRTRWGTRFAVASGMVAVAAIVSIIIFSGLQESKIAENPTSPDLTEIPELPNDGTESEPAELLADAYEDEKEMEIELEGMKEPLAMNLAVNEELRYVLYIEKDNYEFIEQAEEEDFIAFTGDTPENFPATGMYIKKQMHTTLEEQIAYVKDDIEEDGMVLQEEADISDPIDAYEIIAHEDREMEWDRLFHRYYIADMGNGTYFLFKQIYIEEAWEGQAVRFDFMIDTFEYVEEE